MLKIPTFSNLYYVNNTRHVVFFDEILFLCVKELIDIRQVPYEQNKNTTS